MTTLSLPHESEGNGVFELLSRLRATIAVWRRRSYDRHFLAQLGRHERARLGAPLIAIEREIAKPFWRA